MAYAAPLNPKSLEWFLYRIEEPLEIFPQIYGTPTRAWVNKTSGAVITKRLKDILNLPIVADNPKVADIKKDFPEKTMFTGLVRSCEIILIEGMHRACALA